MIRKLSEKQHERIRTIERWFSLETLTKKYGVPKYYIRHVFDEGIFEDRVEKAVEVNKKVIKLDKNEAYAGSLQRDFSYYVRRFPNMDGLF